MYPFRTIVGIGAGVFLLGTAVLPFPSPAIAQDGGAVQAILRTDPDIDAFGAIPLPAAGGSIRLFAGDSFGEGIASYAIDINTVVDSDGDGRANNDADNALHPSFRTGEFWTVNLRAAPGEKERWLRLTVTDGRGMSDTLELLITFIGDTVPLETLLRADQTVLRIGEQFTLRIENAPAEARSFSWDLQGDQVEDARTDVPFLLLQPDAPGVLPVGVSLFDGAGMLLKTVTGEFSIGTSTEEVPDTETPPGVENILTIHAEAVGLSTAFSPEVLTPLNLLRLEPTWSFGDGSTSYLLEPVYTYAVPGSYDVTLSLRDPLTQEEIATARATVTVAEGAGGGEGGSGFLAALGTFFHGLGSLFSGAFFALLTLLLVLLFILGGLFLFLSYEAKKKGHSVRETLETYRKMFFRGVDESPKSALPLPSKKVGEEKPLPVFTPKSTSPVPQKTAPQKSAPPPPAFAPPTSAPPSPTSRGETGKPLPSPTSSPTETESLPPWLRPKTSPDTKAAAPVSPPSPAPSTKPSLPPSPPPVSPKPQTVAPALPTTTPSPPAPKISTPPPPPAPPKASPEKGPLPPWLTPKPASAEPKTSPAPQAAVPAPQAAPPVQKSEVSAPPPPKTLPSPSSTIPSPPPTPSLPSSPPPTPPTAPPTSLGSAELPTSSAVGGLRGTSRGTGKPPAPSTITPPPPPTPASSQKESVPPWLQKAAPALPTEAAPQTLPAPSTPPVETLPPTPPAPSLSAPQKPSLLSSPSSPSSPPPTSPSGLRGAGTSSPAKAEDTPSKDDLEPLAFIKAEDVFPEIPPMEGKPPAKQ